MSTAEVLIARGRAQGMAEAMAEAMAKAKAEAMARWKARGVAIGSLTLVQELMDLPVSSDEELAGLDLAELDRRLKELKGDRRFKELQDRFKRP